MDLSMLEFLRNLDITTFLIIGGMLWVFNSRLDKKFDRIDKRFESSDAKRDKDLAELNAKMDKNSA